MVSDLVQRFDVSVETVRRDLLTMEKEGLLARVHGGAVNVTQMMPYHPLSHRNLEQNDQKDALARTAAALVQDGDYIAIGCGSTPTHFARALMAQRHNLTVVTYSLEIFEILRRPARIIADEVLNVLEMTSPELVGDIADNGITLTGGGSQIYGMAEMLTERTGIRCRLADDPASCVAYGCGKSLSWMNHMTEGTINIARKRLMRE